MEMTDNLSNKTLTNYNIPGSPLWSRIGAKICLVLYGLPAQENSCPGCKHFTSLGHLLNVKKDRKRSRKTSQNTSKCK